MSRDIPRLEELRARLEELEVATADAEAADAEAADACNGAYAAVADVVAKLEEISRSIDDYLSHLDSAALSAVDNASE